MCGTQALKRNTKAGCVVVTNIKCDLFKIKIIEEKLCVSYKMRIVGKIQTNDRVYGRPEWISAGQERFLSAHTCIHDDRYSTYCAFISIAEERYFAFQPFHMQYTINDFLPTCFVYIELISRCAGRILYFVQFKILFVWAKRDLIGIDFFVLVKIAPESVSCEI